MFLLWRSLLPRLLLFLVTLLSFFLVFDFKLNYIYIRYKLTSLFLFRHIVELKPWVEKIEKERRDRIFLLYTHQYMQVYFPESNRIDYYIIIAICILLYTKNGKTLNWNNNYLQLLFAIINCWKNEYIAEEKNIIKVYNRGIFVWLFCRNKKY